MDTKEKVKSYWNSRPCNIKHSKKEFLSKEYFDEVEKKKYFVEKHIPLFADFQKWKGKKVLELDCGIGTDSINFAKHGAQITIVEISDVSLDICKKRFDIYGLSGTFYCGDIEKLQDFLPIQHFDLVYSFGVIHHTPDQNAAFSQISKYISDKTELRIMIYSKISFKLFQILQDSGEKNLSNFEEIIRNNSEAQYGSPVTYSYTFDEITTILNKNEIIVDKIWKDHIFRWNIPDYINNVFVLNEYWKNVPDDIVEMFEKELGWHTLIIAHKK